MRGADKPLAATTGTRSVTQKACRQYGVHRPCCGLNCDPLKCPCASPGPSTSEGVLASGSMLRGDEVSLEAGAPPVPWGLLSLGKERHGKKQACMWRRAMSRHKRGPASSWEAAPEQTLPGTPVGADTSVMDLWPPDCRDDACLSLRPLQVQYFTVAASAHSCEACPTQRRDGHPSCFLTPAGHLSCLLGALPVPPRGSRKISRPSSPRALRGRLPPHVSPTSDRPVSLLLEIIQEASLPLDVLD